MPRFYARKAHRSSGALLPACLAIALSCACGSAQTPTKIGPAPEIVALSDKAEAAERKRQHLDARAFMQQAVDRAQDPVSAAYANRKMARLLLFWRMEAEALPYLEQSVTSGPDQAPVWNDLGVVYSNLGQPAKARAALQRSVELAPKEPRARLGLAAELVRQKDFRTAQSHYRVLLTLDIPAKIENATHRVLELLDKEIALEEK